MKYDELCNHTHEANEGYRRPAVGQPVCSAVRIPWRAGPLRGSVVVDDWHLKWHRDVYNCCTFDSARRIVPTARVRRRNAVTRLSTTAMRTSRTSLSTAHLALDGAPRAPRSRRRTSRTSLSTAHLAHVTHVTHLALDGAPHAPRSRRRR